MACSFQAVIDGKFAPLTRLRDEEMHINYMIIIYNIAMTDAAREILEEERRRKKPWITKDVLDLCGEERFEEEAV